ncbi:HEPN domain-containing protein [Candidatus Poribacteria bacterium]|nr:HEPN domain-containing protein [Candidatus Poribacteria bacterium]
MSEAHKELARTLLKKAEIDLLNASILRDSGKGNPEGIGLHVQQAAEKSLKALLAFHNIHYPKTHSIAGLVGLASDNHIQLPDPFVKSDRYTDYAMGFRYDELDLSDGFDFNEALGLAEACVTFAKSLIENGSS